MHEWLCKCLHVEMHEWGYRRSSCCEHTSQWWALCVAPLCRSSELWDHGYVVPVRPGLRVWPAPTSLAPQLRLSQSRPEPTHLTCKEQASRLKGCRWKLMIQILKFRSKLKNSFIEFRWVKLLHNNSILSWILQTSEWCLLDIFNMKMHSRGALLQLM